MPMAFMVVFENPCKEVSGLNTTFGHRHLPKSAQSAALEPLLPTLFHTTCALSAPSGHLPLEGKAIHTRRRSRHPNPPTKKRTPFEVRFFHTVPFISHLYA